MKKLIVLVSSCLLTAPALAQLAAGHPTYDPFSDATGSGGTSYNVGANLAGQTSASYAAYTSSAQWWLRPGPGSGSTQPTVAAGDLTYPNLYSAGGGRSAAFGPDGNSALMNLETGTGGITPGISGVVYFSYLLKLTDLTSLGTNGVGLVGGTQVQALGGNNPPALSWASVLMVRSDGAGGYNVGLDGGGKGTTLATIAWDSTSYSVSNTLFLVFSYTFNDSANGFASGDGRLWINPDPSSFGAESAPTETLLSGGNNTALARIASIVLEQPAGGPTGQIDDLRAGLNWADVTPNGNYLTIVEDPMSRSLSEGDDAIFHVVADGAAPLAYQWVKNGTTVLSDNGHIFGAHSSTLSISNIISGDTGSYSVYVTNSYGKVALSAEAFLSLTDPAAVKQPASRTNDYGTTATFEVTASGTGPFTYQWSGPSGPLSEGGNVVGSRSNLLALTGVSHLDAGNYYVTVSNSLGASINSDTAVLTVNDPAIVTQPMSTTNTIGATVMFHVVANGSGGPGSFTYLWQANGNLIFDNDHYAGTATDTLIVSNITSADAVNYTATVIGASTTTSSAATLTVLTPPYQPSFDPFADATMNGGTAYSVGSTLVGQKTSTIFGSWYLRGGASGSTQPMIAAGSLSYSGLPTSSGNNVSFAPDNSMSACLDLNLPSGHTETVYYSFLLKITDLSSVPDYATNNPIAAFGDDPSLNFTANQIARLGSRLVTKRVGAGYVLGIGRSASIPDFAYEPDSAAHNLNDVLFVVACYRRDGTVQTNVSLWVNPPSSSFGAAQPPPPTVEAPYPSSLSGGINNSSARAFCLLCQFPSAPAGVVDEVRVDTSWHFVTGVPVLSTPPQFDSIALAGTNVLLSISGGKSNGTFRVVSSTSVESPTTTWESVATNVFDSSGKAVVTNAVAPGSSRRYYRVAE